MVSDLGVVLGIFQVSCMKKQLSQTHSGWFLGLSQAEPGAGLKIICVSPFQLRLFSDSLIDLLFLGQHLKKGPGEKKIKDICQPDALGRCILNLRI